MNTEEAITVIRELFEDPTWEIGHLSVHDLEEYLFENDLQAIYVMALDDIVKHDKPWNTAHECAFWSVVASNEDRVKSAASVLLSIVGGSKSAKAKASSIE